MCLAVYIASNRDLPVVPPDKKDPTFYVSELTISTGVRKQFTLPNVCYVGSSEGCGCGFLKDGVNGEELAKVEREYAQLSTYIATLQKEGSDIELFSCWEGDQSATIDFDEQIGADDLNRKEFEFKEKALYRVRA